MSELIIKLKGEVTDTNFEEWKNELITKLGTVNTKLSTDDDFANAESDVKAIKAGEKSLKEAKASALKQADEIQKLFTAIDEVSGEARDARLKLERQIKKRKAEIKDEIVEHGIESVKSYLQEQSETLQSDRHSWFKEADFEEAIKGKRTTSSMEKAVNGLVVKIKGDIDDRETLINNNQKVLDQIDPQYSAVFQDAQSLLLMDSESLESTIAQRIGYFEEEKKKQVAEEGTGAPETLPQEDAQNVESDNTEDKETTIHPADQSHIISIEVFADVNAAQEFYDEIDDRYSSRGIVGEIRLS